MDTEKYKALLCAIDTGSLTAAAEQLGYTPSGISRIIAALEEENGFSILMRSRSGVRPTGECEEILPTVRELVRLGETLRQRSAQIRGLEIGSITVGTSYSVYYRWLSKLIADFTRLYPGISVRIIEGTSSELSKMVEEGRVDFCIISRRDGHFRWLHLQDDELVVWVPGEHPAVENQSFPLEDFITEPFIELYPGQETDNSRFFSQKGIRPNTRYSTYDVYAAYSMVEAGLGVTLMNSLLAGNWIGDVVTLPLLPAQSVDIGIAVPEEEKISPAAKRLAEFATERIQNVGEEQPPFARAWVSPGRFKPSQL